MLVHLGRCHAPLGAARSLRQLLVASAFINFASLMPALAQSRFCAQYPGGTPNCGYPTFESCRQAVSGLGGICTEASTTLPPPNLLQRMEGRRNPPPSQLPGGNWMPPPPSE